MSDETSGLAKSHDVVIIGGGAAGISVAASLHKRQSDLDIAIVEPAKNHFYQPGWTLVGGGVFNAEQTRQSMHSVMPAFVTWYQAAAESFQPDDQAIVLDNGTTVSYSALIVAPGLELNWQGIEGLEETLGKNGVTSNYRFDLAPYTWSLVKGLEQGKAIFTQPPMPIKCAGAPQKAMYLACDAWKSKGVLNSIDVSFHNAGAALFGVADYVPALDEYINRYGITKAFEQNLIAVDGPNKKARFSVKTEAGTEEVEVEFDMLHVVPPQRAPKFIRESALANEAGWLDVDPETLQHTKYSSIFGLGDVIGTTNAKTAAAVRKQAPVVADNVIASVHRRSLPSAYEGYGACPLTVEKGRIVLAEFGYGGKLQPTLPEWINKGKQATRLAWFLKTTVMPKLYWQGMLKGREILVKPKLRS